MNRKLTLALGAITLLAPSASQAQLFSSFSKQELLDYTAQNPFERMPDGRPRVPDSLIERAKEMSSEEVWAVLPGRGYRNQYADGFHVLHPGKTMVGPGTCEAAWNIIQHSPKIDQHLGLIKRAATKKELPFKLYAMMFDRYLVNLKREQIYGSQVVLIRFKNGQRGWFVWPVRNPKKVNKLSQKLKKIHIPFK